MPEYLHATTSEHFEAARQLFTEYAAWLNVDLCFQSFDKELENLESMYVPPHGDLILCMNEGGYIGCVGIRLFSKDIAEMKRLYVKESARHGGIGRALIKEAEKSALAKGYTEIKLDTLNTMKPAVELYRKNGYKETGSYYNNPLEGVVYFSKKLNQDG